MPLNIRGRRCGSIGDLGCFSFYPGKNLGAYGEGGLVTTNNPEYARTIRMLRDWGAEKKYEHVMKGFNYRMEAIQGAILRIKLQTILNNGRMPGVHTQPHTAPSFPQDTLTLPTEQADSRHVYHVYAVLTEQRREMMASLNAQGIQTGIHYPYPVHLLPGYSDLGYGPGDFPVSERIASQELSLPMFPEMTDAQIMAVAAAVSEFDRTCAQRDQIASSVAAS